MRASRRSEGTPGEDSRSLSDHAEDADTEEESEEHSEVNLLLYITI